MEDINDIWRDDLISSLIIFDFFIIIDSLHQILTNFGLKRYLYLILLVYAIFVLIYTIIMERRANKAEYGDSVKYVRRKYHKKT